MQYASENLIISRLVNRTKSRSTHPAQGPNLCSTWRLNGELVFLYKSKRSITRVHPRSNGVFDVHSNVKVTDYLASILESR